MLPPDIADRLQREYPPSDRAAATAALDNLQELEPEVFSIRLIRCLVHLAQGDLMVLGEWIMKAKLDWKDVIKTAEFDRGVERRRNFDEPFNLASAGMR